MKINDFILYSENCRNMVFDGEKFLISEVGTSLEDKNILGVNCDGFGRIRKFKRNKDSDWISNPLPFDPFSLKMGVQRVDELDVQVFQISKCNLNCWWCFLPDEYRGCNPNHTKWFSVDELLDLFIRDAYPRVKMIDLSGGNPELVPELTLQFMSKLEKYDLSEKIYLWSDDVLSTDFLFTKLSDSQIQYMADYKNYGKVACFKGIDDESFCFNTCSQKSILDSQLDMATQYIRTGFDLYFYIALTVPNMKNLKKKIASFFDKLQLISYYLPLRIVPIKIKKFPHNQHRFTSLRESLIDNQYEVLNSWNEEISKRFTSAEIECNISLLQLN
ncbi:MAG: hypothetical protein E7075_05695 [Bacteroidales bacterium]|nr:hypothetical protein [Bacteroidales bacterium]